MTAVEAWDAAVDEANRTYCKRMHNLCCDNCHSHVCRALQTMQYAVRLAAPRGRFGPKLPCHVALSHPTPF